MEFGNRNRGPIIYGVMALVAFFGLSAQCTQRGQVFSGTVADRLMKFGVWLWDINTLMEFGNRNHAQSIYRVMALVTLLVLSAQ